MTDTAGRGFQLASTLAPSETILALVESIERGADVNATDLYGVSPLHLASCSDDFAEVVHILLKANASVHCRTSFSSTPLHWASRHSSLAVAETLIQAGADIWARDRHGWMPIHDAAASGSGAMVRFLLEEMDKSARARLSAVHQHAAQHAGEEPLYSPSSMEAAYRPSHPWHDCFVADNNLELQRSCGAPGCGEQMARVSYERAQCVAGVNNKDMYGSSPLHIACAFNKLEAAQQLVLFGRADVNGINNDGMTPLHKLALAVPYSSKNDSILSIATMLLDSGACVHAAKLLRHNWTSEQKMRAKMPQTSREPRAIIASASDASDFCVVHAEDQEEGPGMDGDAARCSSGPTALHYAVAQGNTELANLLIARGGLVDARCAGFQR